jgi:CheY-like chemotaxis protein
MVIEDHEDLALVFNTALESAGFDTEVIMDGALAQERLQEVAPTLIILDLHMPNVSGETLLHQIKDDARLADSHVLIATADAALGDKLSSEVDLVLLKPISFTQLSMLAARFLPAAE